MNMEGEKLAINYLNVISIYRSSGAGYIMMSGGEIGHIIHLFFGY
jgi:hypothetical protein